MPAKALSFSGDSVIGCGAGPAAAGGALLSTAGAGAAAANCGAPGEIKSEKPRDLSPDLQEGDLEELVAGNTAFAMELYKSLREEGKNTFFSPHSISTALAMAYAGARGDTEAQMAGALRFTLPQDRLGMYRSGRVDFDRASSFIGQAKHEFAFRRDLAINGGLPLHFA